MKDKPILLCFGTRPEWLKIKPLVKLMDRSEYKLLFTGQHTDLLKDVEVDYKITISENSNRLDSIISDCMLQFPNGDFRGVLVQGDTGSGKTVVAANTMFCVLSAGYQVALMAPTEILAKQHYKTMKKYFEGTPYTVIYLSGKLSLAERKEKLRIIMQDTSILVVGTHALFSEDVRYNNLGYVITDEQHRFGVNQRRKLREKGFNPDVLYMSATPIPRTLAISLFGDMDITSIHEKPKDRIVVETKLFSNNQIDLVYLLIDEQLRLGHQVYVVSPLILESETLDLSNAQKVYSELRKKFSEYEVGIIHSKIKQDDKDQVMEDFNNNKINLLVSTTVIEVGVDVANATIMVIMDADRFGVSQLHQLRGRVGRGTSPGLCLLVSQCEELTPARERLNAVAGTLDGFELSRIDLEQRREGDVLGRNQSGTQSHLRLLRVLRDESLIEQARDDAEQLIAKDNELRDYPALRKELAQLQRDQAVDYLDKG